MQGKSKYCRAPSCSLEMRAKGLLSVKPRSVLILREDTDTKMMAFARACCVLANRQVLPDSNALFLASQDLLGWLRERKRDGFLIIGLEQTGSSLPLETFEFPADKPTVLLLGKEKEGIPAECLQAVDQCLEIPQLGLIRSLNVHVSGAITIWEFTKQRLEATAS